MSSIAQYKDALKRERQIVRDLKKEKDDIYKELIKVAIELKQTKRENTNLIELTNKKWWQFWK